MTDPIDTSIGGNAPERTARGFAVYGSVTDERGNIVRVQRSSAMGDPRCHVFTHDGHDRNCVPCVGAHDGWLAVSPHLDATQARALAAALLRFADDAEATAPSVVSALELAAQECEHVASRHEGAATKATGSGRDVHRAFAAEMRTLAARVRAVPHLARGGSL